MPDVMTVRGPISPDVPGITMCHTYVLSDKRCLFAMPEKASRGALAEAPVTLQNLGAVRRDALANKDNLVHGDVDGAVRELTRYQMMGGGSVVEASPRGFGRDPLGLFKVSNATGLNIICCTGFYICVFRPQLTTHIGPN